MFPLLRVVLWSLVLLPVVSWGQPGPRPRPDSVAGRRAVPRISRRRLVVQYDSRYFILNYHSTTINGLKLGVEFKNCFRTGAAIYFLSTGVPIRRAGPDFAASDAEAELRLRYLAA